VKVDDRGGGGLRGGGLRGGGGEGFLGGGGRRGGGPAADVCVCVGACVWWLAGDGRCLRALLACVLSWPQADWDVLSWPQADWDALCWQMRGRCPAGCMLHVVSCSTGGWESAAVWAPSAPLQFGTAGSCLLHAVASPAAEVSGSSSASAMHSAAAATLQPGISQLRAGGLLRALPGLQLDA
jgi:hypothetical protein